jgi:hypothetical protein
MLRLRVVCCSKEKIARAQGGTPANWMKLQINSWQAVSTWTWNASDDTCGICRQAFDGLVKQRFGLTLLGFHVSFVLIMWTLAPSPSLTCCAAGVALTASFPAMIALSVRLRCCCCRTMHFHTIHIYDAKTIQPLQCTRIQFYDQAHAVLQWAAYASTRSTCTASKSG